MKLSLAHSLLVASSLLAAEPPRLDPLMEHLFPPELIMHNAEDIDLTDDQREQFQAEMHRAHERFEEMHAKREKQLEATAALLKKERVDQAAALAQLENLFERERELRRAHLSLMITLKNKLTPAQQTKLQEIKKDSPRQERAERLDRRPAKPPPSSLQEKMKKLKAGVKKLEDEGGDATAIGEIMHEFKPLMDEQKFKQAEEVLDQALKRLQEQKR